MQQVLLNRGAAAEESITVSKDGNIRAVEALRLSQEDLPVTLKKSTMLYVH